MLINISRNCLVMLCIIVKKAIARYLWVRWWWRTLLDKYSSHVCFNALWLNNSDLLDIYLQLFYVKKKCQSFRMLEYSRQMPLTFFFLGKSKQTESFSSSAPHIPTLSWKSLASALPDGESALWNQLIFSVFPLQYLIRKSNTRSSLAPKGVLGSDCALSICC